MSETPQPEKKPRKNIRKSEAESLPSMPTQMVQARGMMNDEELKEIRNSLPSLASAFVIPENDRKTMPDVMQVVLGTQYGERDIWSILERTRLTDEEIGIMRDLIAKAEHGIGIEGLDFPVPQIGEAVVRTLRGKVSLNGESRQEFERMTTAWIRYLYDKDQQEKLRHSEKMSGVGS